MKTLALIYASEGTGHKSAAFALREAFLAANPEGNALCLDILDFVPPFMKGLLSGGYDVMARSAPWLWSRFYWGSDKRGGQATAFEWVHGQFCRACLPKLRRHLASKGAEAAIFTHYFGAAEFAAMNRGRAPVYYADTDFETHRFQRSREFTMSFAGSARAARQRYAEGITNVMATGVPVAAKYAHMPSKAEARARLGLPANEKIVLVSGGGIGAGPVQKAAESLAAAGYYVLAVCGGNEKLRASMKAFFMYKENVRVEGFVPDMENYYAAADAAVMKPGGLSASEALCAGLPMLLTDPIPGQEELNLSYLAANGAARPLVIPQRAAEAAAEIFESGEAGKMRECALSIAHPRAAAEIIDIVTQDAGAW